MGFISGTFRRVLIFVFTLLLVLAELFTMTLYTLNTASQNDILYEIARTIDLRELMVRDENDESKNKDLSSALDDLKKADESGKLNDIETPDDFMSALSKTRVLKEYISSLFMSFITGSISGDKTERINITALKEALIGAIEELTGLDAENSTELREFAASVIDEYSYKIFNYMMDSVGSDTMMKYFSVDGDNVELVNTLLSENTRKISIVVCAAIALLLLWLCKGAGHWLSGLGSWIGCIGVASMIAGAVFLCCGYFDTHISAFIDKGSYYYLSPLLPAFKETILDFGRKVLYSGAAAVLLYMLFFKRASDK